LKAQVRKLIQRCGKYADKHLLEIIKPSQSALEKIDAMQAEIREQCVTIQDQKTVALQQCAQSDPIGAMCDELLDSLRKADEKLEAARTKVSTSLNMSRTRVLKREPTETKVTTSIISSTGASDDIGIVCLFLS